MAAERPVRLTPRSAGSSRPTGSTGLRSAGSRRRRLRYSPWLRAAARSSTSRSARRMRSPRSRMVDRTRPCRCSRPSSTTAWRRSRSRCGGVRARRGWHTECRSIAPRLGARTRSPRPAGRVCRARLVRWACGRARARQNPSGRRAFAPTDAARPRARGAQARTRRPVPAGRPRGPLETDGEVEDGRRRAAGEDAEGHRERPRQSAGTAVRDHGRRPGSRSRVRSARVDPLREQGARTILGSLDRLGDRPWIAAVVCRWYPVRTIATTQFVLLTRPAGAAAHIDVVRSDGEIVYAGTAQRRGAATTFSIADVQRAGTAPLRLAGRLSAKGVELEVALAGPRRIGTPDTEPVSA